MVAKQHGIWWRSAFTFFLMAMVIGCGGKTEEEPQAAAKDKSANEKKSAPIKIDSKPAAIPQAQQAIAAVEIDFDRIQRSSMGVLFGEEELKQMAGPAGQQMEVLSSLKRLKVYLNAPKNLQAVMAFAQGGPGQAGAAGLPLEFRVEIEFKDAESAKETLEQVKANLQQVTLEGKTMYLPDSQRTGEPPVYFEIVSDTQLKLGSKNYMKLSEVPVTEAVKSQWAKLPAGDFRLVLDLDSARSFFNEISSLLREDVPLMFAQFVDVIDQAAVVTMATDSNSDQMMQLLVEGHNTKDAESIKTVIAGVLDLGVKSSQAQLAQIRQNDPKAAEVFSNLMASMAPKINGNAVMIEVQKPEGFDQVMQESIVKARAAAKQMQGMNDFKQLALSIHNFHDTFRRFPWIPEPNQAHESLSWRVLVLPYIEQLPLYQQFDLKASWDAETNLAAAEQMPELFGKTGNLASVVSIQLDNPPKTFTEIPDGTSNTVMLIETTTPVPWTKAGGITIDEAVEMVSSLEDGKVLRVAYYDGSVRTIDNQLSEQDLRLLFDPRDGM